MLITLQSLIEKYGLKINGIIHIGAHEGQELSDYNALGIRNVVAFEPLPDVWEKLKVEANKYGYETFNIALGEKQGRKEMYRDEANQGQSSSILEPDLHLKYYEGITFNKRELVHVESLDGLGYFRMPAYNMINIDVQGYEGYVMRGAKKTLANIDYIYAEVNRESLYKECTLVDDLDKYLSEFGFQRVETKWTDAGWGDALYVKIKDETEEPAEETAEQVVQKAAEAEKADPIQGQGFVDGFNEQEYLEMNPDVAAAVGRAQFKTGYDHYISWGKKEGRKPHK